MGRPRGVVAWGGSGRDGGSCAQLASGTGPQAALYSEMFPASVRFSGVSISYALGAILGGAFAPMIATALVQATGNINSVAAYIAGMTVISLIAVSLVRDRSGINLSPSNQAEQETGALVMSPAPEAARV